ncbi:class I SAM-dependent methyltransferase [Nesterenkonia salmonea]|uniref:Class I SAM-dependent methyltransferase n=1 Tax=Nesterenkonia salmonea TaxID=1804987 RepID=A0A5R9B8V1_9MICC|nr:class I SAM-dependent methyltransferase [Nesterenkonia salmonea]TLP94741.1 class I SAM-dependent methyltransferase [Nesterenkonia salmonea]
MINEEPVQSLPSTVLLDDEDGQLFSDRRLIINSPGQELPILRALAAHAAPFASVELRLHPLAEATGTSPDEFNLSNVLDNAGYRISERSTNPSGTISYYARRSTRHSALAKSLTELESRIATTETTIVAEQHHNREKLDKLTAGQQRLDTTQEYLARQSRVIRDGVETSIGHLRRQFYNVQTALEISKLSEQPISLQPYNEAWPMAGADLLELMTYILDRRPHTILECGSGMSTVWIGLALKQLGRGRLYSLEHDDHFLAQTQHLIEINGLTDQVSINRAPLDDVSVGDQDFEWYAVDGWQEISDIELLIVDGPPQSTGKLARFPAVPMLLDRLADRATVVLDDADRPDEQEIGRAWSEQYGLDNIRERTAVKQHRSQYFKFQRGGDPIGEELER